MSPEAWTSGYGGRYFVPLDWVELFDGLPLDPATGYLKTTDDEGNYIVYDSSHGIFDNAEPRLKASIMIPGDLYKGGHELDMRCGLIVNGVTPDQKIKKTTKDDGKTTYSWDNGVKEFKVNGQVVAVRSTKKPSEGQPYQDTGIAICGFNGPSTSGGNHCNTGIYGVKWIQRDQPVVELNRSVQPWIDIRYAEVLLNRAEAAIELAQNGASDASNLLIDAMSCINDVRDRAGADLLTSTNQLADLTAPTNVRGTGKNSMVFAPTKGLQIVRVERYKELAFEHKIYWDLRRWFTFHDQINQYRRRMLAPFMFAKGAKVDEATGNPIGKYIYETRVCERANNTLSFATKNYYDKIPDGERKINPLLEQNNQY